MRLRLASPAPLYDERRIGTFRVSESRLCGDLHEVVSKRCVVVRAEFLLHARCLEITAYSWDFAATIPPHGPCTALSDPPRYHWYRDASDEVRAGAGDSPMRVLEGFEYLG